VAFTLLVLLGVALAWWAWENARRKTHPVLAGYRPEIELPFEQEFELYHNALSLCSMKSRVCLAELEIPYRSHHIDLIETGCYENIRRPFLLVNPGSNVPVLVHRGHPVYESHEQIRYAAEHAPPDSPSLLPDDLKLREQMQHWVELSSLTKDPIEHGDESIGNAVPGLTLPLFAAMIGQIAAWKVLEGLLFHFDKLRPLVFLTFKVRGLAKLGRVAPAMQVLARSRRQASHHLDALEKQLVESGGPWILGESFSLADVSWLVIFERMLQADCLEVFLGQGKRPACAAYWGRLQARPSYRAAILDQSHPSVTHGTQRLKQAKAADPSLREALEGPAEPMAAHIS
jgi:glutathione S-transferase